MSLFAVAFTLWGSPVTWLEILAFGLSLAMVAANMRVKVVGWPLAMSTFHSLPLAQITTALESGVQSKLG